MTSSARRSGRWPALAMTLWCAACTAFPGGRPTADELASEGFVASASMAPAERAGTFAAADDLLVSPASAVPADRLMIRSADLTIEVPRPDDAVAACGRLAEQHGGYVARRDGTALTCRVPAAAFDAFVDGLRGLGRVAHESMQTLDVTEQHRDLTIRLDNAKHARERLLALLERAEAVEDLLKIEAELRRLTEEIERMTAELENLDGRIALATIAVTFTPSEPQGRPTRRRPSRFWWINTIGAEHVLRSF